jgi:exodeoxyribonuclease VII large subunit
VKADFELPGLAVQPESVTEFTRRLKGVLETGVRPCWVRGEVSNLRVQASGHAYFSLKDAGAQLGAVLFRGDAQRQTVKLRDGAQVVVYGEVSVYEARGQYQLIVRVVVPEPRCRISPASSPGASGAAASWCCQPKCRVLAPRAR